MKRACATALCVIFGVAGLVVTRAATTRVDQTSASITYTSAWQQGNTDRAWSGGTAAVSNTALARASLHFNGSGVKWIGFRGPQAGIARVHLDGAQVATVDLFSFGEQVQTVVFTASGLPSGSHTLAVEVTGAKNLFASDAHVVVDAFEVEGADARDTTPPSVSVTSPASGSTVSGTIAVRASATDNVGVAGVQFYVDGAPLGAEDTAAPYEIGWDTATTTDGSHTLTARARDAAGNTSTSTAVSVTVANGSDGGATTKRIEETSLAVTYSGTWGHGNTDRSWSGGTAAVSVAGGARATISFSGTGVKWLGFRGPQAGVADVYLDGTRVATVDLYAPSEAIRAVVFEADGLVSETHTLVIEVPTPRTKNPASSDYYVVVDAFDVTGEGAQPPNPGTTGDVFVSLEPGPVQWWNADGTFRATLLSTVPGNGEGMGFDASGNLYVTRWCIGSGCANGAPSGIEVFDRSGLSKGRLPGEWDCGPHAIVFDALDRAYVGNAGCTGAIWRIAAGQPRIEFPVATENYGSFWIDLAPDGCRMFYTSWGPNVKRYDVCTRTQLPNFNKAPLPGGSDTHDLRVLPDGGLIVSNGGVIARLNASGVVIQTYSMPEPSYWTGLDLVGDGTFWVGNYATSNVYRFDIATGEVIDGFNTGTPPRTVVGIRVRK